jgi:hypothetical protein
MHSQTILLAALALSQGLALSTSGSVLVNRYAVSFNPSTAGGGISADVN